MAPRPGAIASGAAGRRTLQGDVAGHGDVACGRFTSVLTEQQNQKVACGYPGCVGTRMAGPARSVEFARGDSCQANLDATAAPDGPIAIPHKYGRARKGSACGNDRGACQQDASDQHRCPSPDAMARMARLMESSRAGSTSGSVRPVAMPSSAERTPSISSSWAIASRSADRRGSSPSRRQCIIGTQIYGRIGSLGMGRFRSQRVDPKGQKSVLVELGVVGKHIISGQIDVIPAQRGDLPQ